MVLTQSYYLCAAELQTNSPSKGLSLFDSLNSSRKYFSMSSHKNMYAIKTVHSCLCDKTIYSFISLYKDINHWSAVYLCNYYFRENKQFSPWTLNWHIIGTPPVRDNTQSCTFILDMKHCICLNASDTHHYAQCWHIRKPRWPIKVKVGLTENKYEEYLELEQIIICCTFKSQVFV